MVHTIRTRYAMRNCLRLLLSFLVGCTLCVSIRIRGSLERIYNPSMPEIRCEAANGITLSNVMWIRNGEEIVGDNPLIVSDLLADYPQLYEGQYRCIHYNATSAPLNLYVLPEPEGGQTIEQLTTVGDDAIIQCPIRFGSLRDRYDVRWTIDGNVVVNSSDYLILWDPTDRLIIKNVAFDHRVAFQCVATLDGLHPARSPLVELIILYQAPNILSIGPSNPVVVNEGGTIQVFCNVSGVPRPEIEWCINGECSSDGLSNERYVVDRERVTLLILSAREEDDGFIMCRIASNKTINMTAELVLLYQIEVGVFRVQDDSVIVRVTLRREIIFDYKIVVFVDDRLHETFDGIQGKTNCNYTLSCLIQGRITARISIGEKDSAISDSVEIPPPSVIEYSTNNDDLSTGAVVSITAVSTFIITFTLVVTVTVVIMYNRGRLKKIARIYFRENQENNQWVRDIQMEPNAILDRDTIEVETDPAYATVKMKTHVVTVQCK